jgi:hypothetical protein
MQITDNKGAEPSDFVGWFEEVGHHDRHHACRRRRSDAVVGILKRQTQVRFHAELRGGFQKRIRCRLSSFVVALPDDLLEAPDEIMGGQVSFDGTPG